MKTFITKISVILFWLFCILLTIGCSEDEVIKEADPNPLKLEATMNPIVLDSDNIDKEIVAFIWEPAPDRSEEGTTLEEYLFRMDIADNNFETSIPVSSIQEGTFYKSFTSRTLSKIINEQWNINLGDDISLDVRVIARYSNPDKFIEPIICTITIPIHTKELASHPLYFLGSATLAGDDPDYAIGMTELMAGEIYNWRGPLNTGEFYFILTPGSTYPAYKQGNNKDELIYINSEESTAPAFTIEKAGTYSILVNIRTGRISYEEVIPYEISVNGTGCDYDWLDLSGKLICDPYHPHEWSITVELKSGYIRFNASGLDSGTFAYRPILANTYITESVQQVLLMSRPEYRWQIRSEDAGTYHITLDTKNNLIKFIKLY